MLIWGKRQCEILPSLYISRLLEFTYAPVERIDRNLFGKKNHNCYCQLCWDLIGWKLKYLLPKNICWPCYECPVYTCSLMQSLCFCRSEIHDTVAGQRTHWETIKAVFLLRNYKSDSTNDHGMFPFRVFNLKLNCVKNLK